jgi:hypothetical protein
VLEHFFCVSEDFLAAGPCFWTSSPSAWVWSCILGAEYLWGSFSPRHHPCALWPVSPWRLFWAAESCRPKDGSMHSWEVLRHQRCLVCPKF